MLIKRRKNGSIKGVQMFSPGWLSRREKATVQEGKQVKRRKVSAAKQLDYKGVFVPRLSLFPEFPISLFQDCPIALFHYCPISLFHYCPIPLPVSPGLPPLPSLTVPH